MMPIYLYVAIINSYNPTITIQFGRVLHYVKNMCKQQRNSFPNIVIALITKCLRIKQLHNPFSNIIAQYLILEGTIDTTIYTGYETFPGDNSSIGNVLATRRISNIELLYEFIFIS